jgi:hypothetical protein
MILMWDSAARCGELTGLRVRDLRLDTTHPVVYLHGKGNKTRIVPLLARTVEHCRQHLRRRHGDEPAGSMRSCSSPRSTGNASPCPPTPSPRSSTPTGNQPARPVPRYRSGFIRVGREIKAGTVWTDTWAVVHDQFEEGGFRQSGMGRLNGLRGLEPLRTARVQSG